MVKILKKYLKILDDETLSLKSGTDISNIDSTHSESSKGINSNISRLSEKETK
jgi:hypothetical protein